MEPAQGLHPHPHNPNNGDIDDIASIVTNGAARPSSPTTARYRRAPLARRPDGTEVLMVPVLHTRWTRTLGGGSCCDNRSPRRQDGTSVAAGPAVIISETDKPDRHRYDDRPSTT
jgi:hypothetical protein